MATYAPTAPQSQKTGMAAAISIIAAVCSFIATFAGHPVIGLLLAILAVPVGGLGLAMAASPRVSGGVISIIAIVLGIIGVVVGILGIIGVMIF